MMDTWGLLGQALECSVCLEQLDATSRVLPCQHTFCRKCLIDIINTRKELRCPECRELVTVPFNSLPSNILLLRILEGIKKIPPNPNAGDLLELSSSIPQPSSHQASKPTDPFSVFNQIASASSVVTTAEVNNESNQLTQNPFIESVSRVTNLIANTPDVTVNAQMKIVGNDNLPNSNSSNITQSLSRSNNEQPVSGDMLDLLSSVSRNLTISNTLPSSCSLKSTLSSPLAQAHNLVYTNSLGNSSSNSSGHLSYTQESNVLRQSPGPVLNNLSGSRSSSSIPASTSPNNINESLVESDTTLEESSLLSIRPSLSRQVSSRSLRESQLAGISMQAYVPPLNIQAKALYNYSGKEARDLKFSKGDVITVTKQIDENWFQGELDGQTGIVPASYIKMLDPAASHIPQCKALYDFKMVSEEERNCLMFSKGETITVLRRIDENWAEGKLNSHIGIFPLSFVEFNDAAKALIRLSGSVASHSLHPSAGFSFNTSSLTVTTPTNTVATLPSVLTPSPSHSSPQTAQPSLTPTDQNQSTTKRHSFTDSQSGPSVPNPATPASSRLSAGTPSSNAPTSPSKSSCASVVTKRSDVVRPHSQGEIDTRNKALTLTALENLQLYLALHSYRPRKADELELKKGLLYSVAEKCQDGWFKGRCLNTDKIGVFPGNYVQLADAQTVSSSFPWSSRNVSNGSGSQVPPASLAELIRLKRIKSSTQQANGDVKILNNGVVCPPDLPPRSTTGSGKLSSGTTHTSQNSTADRPVLKDPVINVSPCPSPVSPQIDKKTNSKDRNTTNGGGISLMRKLTSGKRKTKSPPLLSIDNPVFDDSSSNRSKTNTSSNNVADQRNSSDINLKSKQPVPLIKERYRCVVPYPANSDYELELQVGDIVYVHKKREDGWFKGTLLRTGRTGLFPSIFVESC